LYQQTANTYGAALERLAKAYEADPEKRRDLLQEIHVAIWQSFAGFIILWYLQIESARSR
jgi:RNA polymerase sigma-70 factor, ECF subfamily